MSSMKVGYADVHEWDCDFFDRLLQLNEELHDLYS